MTNRIICTTIFLSLGVTVFSQAVSEAVRYSFFNQVSSARSVGAGNAFSSLGADLSTASTNPAGIAEFRKSEFVVSLDAFNRATGSTFNGATFDDSRDVMGFNQIGAVFVNRPESGIWETMNFAFGVNTNNIFHQKFDFEGVSSGSIVERFTELANGLSPNELDNFEAGLAFDVQLLYDFEDDNFYESDFTDFSAAVNKRQAVDIRGSQKEMYITGAGNLNNKLSIGFTLGLPLIRFEQTKVYEESDPNDIVPFFIDSEFVDYLETTGIGLNAKVGVIYKVTKSLRVSAAIHSPSMLFLKDVSTTDLRHSLQTDMLEELESLSPEGDFSYRLTTPSRIIAGASYLLRAGNLRGFISGEAEYVAYSSNKFNLTANSDSAGDLDFQEELNNRVGDQLTSALNIRVGAELGYNKYRVRVGFEQIGDPYSSGGAGDQGNLTFGLGLRLDRSYFDIAYKATTSQEDYEPYSLANTTRQPIVANNVDDRHIMLTAGFKF